MQPVRIGLNAAVVLLILLLSVPLQLILSHLVSSLSTASEGGGDITVARNEATEQLVDTAESVFGTLHSTMSYYSTWNRLKELVLVPYRRKSRTDLKSTVFRSKVGTTTILISSVDGEKTKKSSSDDSIASPSGTGKTGKTGSSTSTASSDQSKQSSQFHKSDGTGKAGKTNSPQKVSSTTKTAATGTTKAPKSPIIEEVSHAREVEEYLMSEVYFGQSETPRSHRPSSVTYSVGQIVRHKTANYVGVVIGWDKVAKAPEKWIRRYYGERPGVELTTHYLILIDSKYSASGSPYHYIPQEDIEPGPHEQLRCPEVTEYFEGFKNGRHIPKPWLQNRYPLD